MAKIIVYEKITDEANLIKRILQKKGHDAYAFSTYEEAADFVFSKKVDLLIIDIELINKNPLKFLKKIKKRFLSTRILMLADYQFREAAKESLKLGANGHLIRPVEREKLEEELNCILNSLGNS